MSAIINMKQDTEYHRCSLPGEPWDILPKFIEGGIFVNLRRKLKRFTMINKRHPLTRAYAPSLNRLKEEEKAHLVEHYNMIHPFSMFSFYFNMIVCIMLLTFFITAPILYLITQDRIVLSILMLPVNSMYFSLIVINFVVGYYDLSHNMVTMKKGDVAKRYLQTYFVPDLLAFLPQLIRFRNMDTKAYNVLSPLLVAIRYLRYLWCLEVLQHLRLYYGLTTFVYKTTKLLLSILVGLVLSIYLLFAFVADIDRNYIEAFLKHSEQTLKMLMMINHGRRSNEKSVSELMYPNFFILIGFIFHLAVLVQTMEIWFKYFSAESQQSTVYDSVNAYMRYKALPVNLRERIFLYMEFKYQGHFYKDSVIRKATSHYLRKEIILAATKNIRKVELFYRIPSVVLRKIRANLVSEIFLPGDVIIRAGNTGQCMFLLLAGTVLVTTPEDKEICYLRDGSHFGEIALVIDLHRIANVTAITPCELFKLDRFRFWTIMTKHPELWKEIQALATERLSRATQSPSLLDTPFQLKADR